MRKTTPIFVAALLTGTFIVGSAQESKNTPIKAGEFSFTYGDEWVRQAVTSSMRAGQLTFKQTDENLKNVDVVFFYFGPGGAGGIQANIDRWVGQFVGEAETKTEKTKVNGKDVVYFTGKGTFEDSVGGPFSGNRVQRKGYSVLAAILPSEKGPVFLKMTGPADSVEAARPSFVKVVESALKKEE